VTCFAVPGDPWNALAHARLAEKHRGIQMPARSKYRATENYFCDGYHIARDEPVSCGSRPQHERKDADHKQMEIASCLNLIASLGAATLIWGVRLCRHFRSQLDRSPPRQGSSCESEK
jgi:hypothetical protein